MIHITIPGEPVAQGRARFSTMNGFVRAYDPLKSRLYKGYVKDMASGQFVPLEGPICMLAIFYRSIPKSWSKKKQAEALAMTLMPISKPDADNYIKAVKDALNGVLYRDDSQIVLPIPLKAYSDQPRADIYLTSKMNWPDTLKTLITLVKGEDDAN